MKAIAPPKPVHRMPPDVRREPLRIGKIVYLTIIGALVLVLLHMAFGHLYLLRGYAFVFAPSTVIALEFDARVTEVNVGEGERIEEGRLILRYDSLDLRRDVVEYATRISELEEKLGQARIESARLDATIDAARAYSAVAGEVEGAVSQLLDQGLAPNARLSTEARRHFEAQRDLLAFEAERDQLRQEIGRLAASLEATRGYLADLMERFGDGTVRARRAGVVSGLNVLPGAVVPAGVELLRIFAGEPFLLAYLEDASRITHDAGDPVLVDFPGGPTVVGRVARLTWVADRLPAEFQPQFKPADRERLVYVDVDTALLARFPVMTTASIYKPLGLEPALAVLHRVRSGFARFRASVMYPSDPLPRSAMHGPRAQEWPYEKALLLGF